MAAVTQKILDGDRLAVFKFLNNDTDETSATTKIDISDDSAINPGPDGTQPTSLRILRVWYSLGADPLDFYFGATANQLVWAFGPGDSGYVDFRGAGGLRPQNTAAAGFTGDFIVQMRGTFAAATDGYSLIVEFEKRYD
jgi:hypothetical protein